MIVNIIKKSSLPHLSGIGIKETHFNVKSISYGSGYYSVYKYDGHTFRYPQNQIISVEEVRDV